jgi:nucleoid-associated protein
MSEEYQAVTDVQNVIVHNLVKEQHSNQAVLDLRDEPMEVTPLAQRLIDLLFREYTKRPSKSFGRFDGDEDLAPSQKYLREYFIEKSLSFYKLSAGLMKSLADEAAKKTASTGGHVFIAHVVHDTTDYMLIAVITDEQAIALTSSKELAPVEHLNLTGFRFAGRVNLTAWQSEDDRYISFLKGTGDTASYFKSFLACSTAIANLKDTQQLTEATRHFALAATLDGVALTDVQRDTFLRKIDTRCREMADTNEPLNLEHFANEMWPTSPKDLLEVLTSNEYKLNDGFVPNKRGLSGLVSFRGTSAQGHWKIEFDRDGLSSGNVAYDKEQNCIRLYNVPADLAQKLREEAGTS